MERTEILNLTTDIVSAYVSNNSVSLCDLTGLIYSTHKALVAVSGGEAVEAPKPSGPAVSIKKSVAPDFIVCLEDGRKFKSMKRHLRAVYNLTPEQYREKWGLPKNYPMVAPSYAEHRSALARAAGLGQRLREHPKG